MSVGLIFCAGLGKRLGKLTAENPKCMIDINGKPCLEHIVEYLESYGIDKVIVNTHWMPLKIMDYFGDRLLYTFEPVLLGESNTLRRLKRWLQNEFVVMVNGDTLSDVNLDLMLEVCKRGGVSVKHYDKGVYAGYAILHKDYFNGNTDFTNLISPANWIDIGSPKSLKEARKLYAK